MAVKRSLVEKTYNKPYLSRDDLAKSYDNMLNKVENMIENNSIYATWIVFRVSKSENDYIEFNSSSTNKMENLIVSMTNKKSGSGYANSFSLTIRYDPFNYGQNASDSIEKLDNMIADAMSQDINEDSDYLRGYIQYGYNSTDDTNLVSPLYQYILTGISSVVKTATGVTEYTFEGTSELASDCNYSDAFPAKEEVNIVQYVGEVLYKYYGTASSKPSFMNSSTEAIEPIEGSPGYCIDISDELIEQALSTSVSAYESITPFAYCEAILENKFNKEDTEKYDTSDTIKEADKPKYSLYITDGDGKPTIHLAYAKPSANNDNTKLSYVFTWGKQLPSLVTSWEPEVNLKLYVIQKSLSKRVKPLKEDAQQAIDEYKTSVNEGASSADIETKKSAAHKAVEAYEEKYNQMSSETNDYPSAKMSFIGIPCDIPIACEVQVIPRNLESESRLAGYYKVRGCTDTINESGLFTTQLELMRLRGINDSAYEKTTDDSLTNALNEIDQEAAKKTAENVSAATNTDGSHGGGEGGRRHAINRKETINGYTK